MIIEMEGMEEKPDYTLKLIKSFGRFLLVAMDKKGNQKSICSVDNEGEVYVCNSSISKAFSKM